MFETIKFKFKANEACAFFIEILYSWFLRPGSSPRGTPERTPHGHSQTLKTNNKLNLNDFLTER